MAVLLPGQARPDRVAHPQAWAVQGSRPSPAERRGREEGRDGTAVVEPAGSLPSSPTHFQPSEGNPSHFKWRKTQH